jgi:hypothetical protein
MKSRPPPENPGREEEQTERTEKLFARKNALAPAKGVSQLLWRFLSVASVFSC